MKYRKKPVEVEAERWYPSGAENATPIIDWILANGGTARYDEGDPDAGVPESIAVDTLEGTMRATAGDFVIMGVAGEFYPCKPDIFVRTYEQVDS